MSMTKPTSEQVTFLAAGAGATQRTALDKFRDTVSVRDFGAVGDGVTDDTAAINAAAASGAKNVYVPTGTYRVLASISLPRNVSLHGDGPNASIIDGSGASPLSVAGGHIIVQPGTWTPLPDLASDPLPGRSNLVFASAPSLVAGDVICIFNPADGSWNPGLANARAGEMQRVIGVSGTSVTVQGGFFESYVAADVDMYVLSSPSTATISEIGVRCLALTSTPEYAFGIYVSNAVDFALRNVRVTNASWAGILITRSFNVSVSDCTVQEDGVITHLTDYGLAIQNSTSVFVNGGYYYGARRALTAGGGGGVCSVPSRFIEFTNLTAASNAVTVGAIDFHPQCEYCTVDSCFADGGITAVGDHIQLTNNIIVGKGLATRPINCYAGGLRGTSIVIDGNLIENHFVGFVDSEGIYISIPATAQVGGTISITNNSIMLYNPATTLAPWRSWAQIENNGYTGTDIGITIQGNTITSEVTSVKAGCRIRAFGSSAPYRHICVQDNVAMNCGLVSVDHGDASLAAALDVHVSNNTVINADSVQTGRDVYAIQLKDIQESAVVTGNMIRKSGETPITVAGNATIPVKHAVISSNTIIDGLRLNTGSAITNTDIYVQQATNCACVGNLVGTASGARSYGMSFDTVGSLLLRDNTAWQAVNSGNYLNAVTAYLPNSIIAGSATYDPPNLVDGAGDTTTVTVTGAALGDAVESVSFSLNLQGITVTAYVSAANTVSVRFQNESGGTLDLGSGTLRVRVRKA